MTLLHRRTLLLSLALLVVTTLVYWPGLGGGFLFDDYPNIVSNSQIHAQSLSWDALRDAAQAYGAGAYGRPLATVTFALDYLVSGKNAWAFKVSSLVVHLANALLIFWLLRRVLALPREGEQRQVWPPIAAFAIALLWAIHPLQVSTVLYVVQRMETLSLTFVLLALIAYLHGRMAQRVGRRGWPWLAASAVLAGIGMLSKETAVLLPVYALALELTVLGFDARSHRTQRLLKHAYAAACLIGFVVFIAYALPRYAVGEVYAGRDFSLQERLLTQLRVLPMYLGQILLPLPSTLTFYYDAYPKSTDWLSPATTLAGALFLLTLLIVAAKVRRRLPLVALGILWFFAAHLLTSNVFALELVFEHRNYFALVGVLLALAELVRRIPMRDGPALKYIAVSSIVVAFGVLACVRSATWGEPLLLASDMVSKNPSSPRASNDLAEQFMLLSGMNAQSPFYSMAQQEFERGGRLPGASPLPEQGLILMAAASGQTADPAWWHRLNEKIRTHPIGPQEKGAVNGLVQQRYKGFELDDEQLGLALATLFLRTKMPPQAYVDYANYALSYLHDERLAARMFVAAVDHHSDDPAYAARLVSDLLGQGHVGPARAVIERARALGLTRDPVFKSTIDRTSK